MKRMLLMTVDFPPKRGGVARYLSSLSKYFGEKLEVVGYPEKKLLFKYVWPRWFKAFFIEISLSNKFDLAVSSHILPLGLVCYLGKVFMRKPYVIILHGMDFALARRNKWKRFLVKKILKSAHIVVTNTEALAREVKGFVTVKNILVIYPTLSDELYELAQNTHHENNNNESVNLLTVARLVPRKGHTHVLDALAILRDQGIVTPIRYYIVGDGPMFKSLQEQVKTLKLHNSVVFIRTASDEDLIGYYRRADIFIMPTEHLGKDIEGFGTVYIEAAAFGVPSIASRLPGVDEAVLDGQTGLLVEPHSALEVSVAIDRLVNDLELRSKLGEQAQIRALSQFRPEKQFSKLISYL